MAQFIKKIVHKQSRSSSPTKRRLYESVPSWYNPYDTGNSNFNTAPYHAAGALPGTTTTAANTYNICQFCHSKIHHDCIRNPDEYLGFSHPQHLTTTDNDHYNYNNDLDNPQSYNSHYQPLLPTNYQYKKFDFQFWKPETNAPPSNDFDAIQQIPSSSDHQFKESPKAKEKEKHDPHKKRDLSNVAEQHVSVAVETAPSSTLQSKDYHDIPVFVDENTNTRHRSYSPKKSPVFSSTKSARKSRSKSPTKKSRQVSTVLSYVSPQCQNGGCSASIFVENTKFLVCKQQLSHVSDYFRSLFMANRSIQISGAMQNSLNEFSIVVSSFTNPPPATQFKWFLESVIQAPILRDITDDRLETLMRLSKRFRAEGLEMRCARYIQENVNQKTPMVALCWLNWVLKHKFDKATHDACLPRVATSSLTCLEGHRNMITEKLLADLFAAKLRTLYAQAVNVFQTIHSMDHFYVDVDRCPRCGRQREQSRVRLYISPCKKAIGCERCFKEKDCEIVSKMPGTYQAFYQCPHGLTPLNDRTPDCQCQVTLLASQLSGLFVNEEELNNQDND